MNLPITVRSASLPLQLLIAGRALDSLTNDAPRGDLTIRLVDRDSGDTYPLAERVLPDGTFAFYAVPEAAFPLLAQQDYRLRVEASAPNYQPDAFEFDLVSTAGQPALVARPVPLPGIEDMHVRLFSGDPAASDDLPITTIALSLDRNPVRLRGRVVDSADPPNGVDGAQLRLNPPGGPQVVADVEGNFEFPDPLPVELSVRIQVRAPQFENVTLTYEPDYTRPINFLTIRLQHS